MFTENKRLVCKRKYAEVQKLKRLHIILKQMALPVRLKRRTNE